MQEKLYSVLVLIFCAKPRSGRIIISRTPLRPRHRLALMEAYSPGILALCPGSPALAVPRLLLPPRTTRTRSPPDPPSASRWSGFSGWRLVSMLGWK